MNHLKIVRVVADGCEDDMMEEKEEEDGTTTRISDVVTAVVDVVEDLKPGKIVVDASSSENYHQVEELRQALQIRSTTADADAAVDIIAITEDSSLFPFATQTRALGRSRFGGRILRWSTFLSNLTHLTTTHNNDTNERQKFTVPLPLPPPLTLPPSIDSKQCSDSLPSPDATGSWATNILTRWGDITEDEALRRVVGQSNDFDVGPPPSPSTTTTTSTGTPSTLGNRGTTSNHHHNSSTRLSPYLRWGLISPRQIFHTNNTIVRTRDLLWRDWSHMCTRVIRPLREGQPVLPYLDGCCRTSTTNNNTTTTEQYNTDEWAFAAWCTGQTGSPTIDAGMRQLWHEGWMPRHIRLLTASCLVEGMGLDWRRGRDWFQYTLLDHDPAINELMWQNAGFCGVDGFYRGLRWEGDGGGGVEEDRKYVEYWAEREVAVPPSFIGSSLWDSKDGVRVLPFTSSYKDLVQLADARRKVLQRGGQYKAAAKVANGGVRVAWENLSATTTENKTNTTKTNTTPNASSSSVVVVPGDVWGVGNVALDQLYF